MHARRSVMRTWIGNAHVDRLLTYPQVNNLSTSGALPHDSLVRGRPRDHQGTISPGRPLVRRRYRHGLGARPHYGRSRRGRHRRQPCRQHRPGHAAPSIRPRPREGGRARRRAPIPAQCQGQSPKVQTTSTRNAPRPPFHAKSSALWGTTPHTRSATTPSKLGTPNLTSATPRPQCHPTPRAAQAPGQHVLDHAVRGVPGTAPAHYHAVRRPD